MSKAKEIEKKVIKIHLREMHGEYFPADVIGDIKRGLSPTAKGRKILKGITEQEEEKLLPRILGIDKSDPKYHEKVNEFWNSLSRYVKYSTGLELDVSIDDKGEPINPEDYILYKRALVMPNVAKNKAESRTNLSYWFYIQDIEADKLTTNRNIRKATEAMQLYLKHSEDQNTTDLLLWMFNENPYSYDKVTKENILYDKATNNPEAFIEYCKDKNLEVKAEIYSLLHYQVLRKIGNTFAFMDTDMGDSIDDAVVFYKDAKNSSLVVNMKAQLKTKMEK